MKIKPYLHFNGNCEEAIALYEKAFGVKAHIIRYSDAPASEGYQSPPGTENYVMHACLTNRSDYTVFMCDIPPNETSIFGNAMSICMGLDTVESATFAFDVLKESGVVTMELQKTFWSELFGSLVDRYGVKWMISVNLD